MSWEKPCQCCRVYMLVDQLVRVDVFPLDWVCSPCAAELLADDEDPRSGELNEDAGPPCDSCRDVCPVCTPGA